MWGQSSDLKGGVRAEGVWGDRAQRFEEEVRAVGFWGGGEGFRGAEGFWGGQSSEI